jgi:membrane dipeptidase
VLTLDSHADILLPSTPKRYFLADGGSRVDLAHLTAGGIDAVVLAVAVGPGPRDAAGVAAARHEADAKLAWIKAFVAGNPERVGLALGAADVERLHREGKVAVIIGFQNARSIGGDLSQIDVFYKAGVRVFAFNHAGHNDLADSSRPGNEPESVNGGLSPLGRDAVNRLNDLGVLIDVSQLSTAALLQTLRLTRVPVAATHSSARALIDNTRNLSDEELDAIKANGGVVQVTPFSAYLHKQDADSLRKIADVRARYALPTTFASPTDGLGSLPRERQDIFVDEVGAAQSRGTLAEFVDHIDYIARRIGWQHVGIGTDFDHGAGVIGFDSEADALNVTRELVRRGYDEERIRAIWGGNSCGSCAPPRRAGPASACRPGDLWP